VKTPHLDPLPVNPESFRGKAGARRTRPLSHPKGEGQGEGSSSKTNEPRIVQPEARPCKLKFRLAFRELESLASPRLTVFLSLFHSGVAGQETLVAQRVLEFARGLKKCSGNAQTNRSRLAGDAATSDTDGDVVLVSRLRDRQRLKRMGPQFLNGDVLLELAVVHNELAGPRRETHARHAALAAAGAHERVDNFLCHENVSYPQLVIRKAVRVSGPCADDPARRTPSSW
jgi:hypothetical protein